MTEHEKTETWSEIGTYSKWLKDVANIQDLNRAEMYVKELQRLVELLIKSKKENK